MSVRLQRAIRTRALAPAVNLAGVSPDHNSGCHLSIHLTLGRDANPGVHPDTSNAVTPQGQTPLPRPQLMHSNLGSVDEVIETSKLPDTTRPAILAFGTLADGFWPFNTPPTSGGTSDSGAARPAASEYVTEAFTPQRHGLRQCQWVELLDAST